MEQDKSVWDLNPWTISSEEYGVFESVCVFQIATCTSRNGYPTPTLTWYKDGVPLKMDGNGESLAGEAKSIKADSEA